MRIALLGCRQYLTKSASSTARFPLAVSPFCYRQSRHSSINSGINRGLRASRIAARGPRELRQREQKGYAPREHGVSKPRFGAAGRTEPTTREPYLATADRLGTTREHRKQNSFRSDTSQSRDNVTAQKYQPHEELEDGYDEISSAAVPYTTAASTFIFGHRPALAAIRANRRKIYSLYLRGSPTKDKDRYQDLIDVAKTIDLRCQWKSKTFIKRIQDAIQTTDSAPIVDDGVCVEVSPLPQQPLISLKTVSPHSGTFNVELDHQSWEEANINGINNHIKYLDKDWRAPCLLWLDGVVDAHNVGAILRNAMYFGIDGVLLSSRATAGISPGVLKASAGAAEYLPIFKINDPKTFILTSRNSSWAFYATVAPTAKAPRRSSISVQGSEPLMLQDFVESPAAHHPCVIVLGNEDEGLPSYLVNLMDRKISIGGISQAAEEASIDSLNVSVASALFCEKFLSRPQSVRAGSNSQPIRMNNQLNGRDETRSQSFRLISHRSRGQIKGNR